MPAIPRPLFSPPAPVACVLGGKLTSAESNEMLGLTNGANRRAASNQKAALSRAYIWRECAKNILELQHEQS